MAKIYCHINQCNVSVQYFSILHADKYCTITEKPIKLKMRSLLAFIPNNKRRSMMRQILRQKKFCHATYADGRATESLCSATKTFSHTIKQLLHQYHKLLALCNIKGELASSFSLNIARSQYFVALMQ